jgi:hypothetical protein
MPPQVSSQTARVFDDRLRLGDAAREIGLHPSSLRRLITRGRVPATKIEGAWTLGADVVQMMCANYDTRPGIKPSPFLC